MQLLLQRREVRQAPRSFKDERQHAFSATRARKRQGRRKEQIQCLFQRREVQQTLRSFKDERIAVREHHGETTGAQEKQLGLKEQQQPNFSVETAHVLDRWDDKY